VGDHAIERRRDGVEAPEDEQEPEVEQLLVGHPLAVDLTLREAREQVVARVGAPVGDDVLEVRVDGLTRFVPFRGQPVEVVEQLRVAHLRPDDVVLPSEELLEVLVGQPAHLDEHRAGERHRELRVEVARAFCRELVDELVGQRPDTFLPRCHLPRRELWVHHPAELHVLGRIDL